VPAPLGEAAGSDEQLAGALVGGQIAQRRNRFLAGGGDEAARIDDQHFGAVGRRGAAQPGFVE